MPIQDFLTTILLEVNGANFNILLDLILDKDFARHDNAVVSSLVLEQDFRFDAKIK
jgi:hypothetical protein